MVTRKSATSTGLTGVSDEDIVPMETDHSGLVKFESRGQDAYIVVRERIRDFVLGAARGLGNRDLRSMLDHCLQSVPTNMERANYLE